jgi:hypothetical protein
MTAPHPPFPPLSLRGYGRHRKALGLPGGDDKAVRVAVRDGRIPRELVTADGKIRDAEEADAAWLARTHEKYVPRSGPTAPKQQASRPSICVEADAVVLRYPLAGFMAGAAAALRAAGRVRTSAALWEAVEAMEALDWWALMSEDVIGRTNADVSVDDLEAAWEQAGREAVGAP